MGSTPPGHTLPGSPPVELQERLARAMEPLMIRTPKEEPSTPTPAGPANPSPSSLFPEPSLAGDVTNVSFVTPSTAPHPPKPAMYISPLLLTPSTDLPPLPSIT